MFRPMLDPDGKRWSTRPGTRPVTNATRYSRWSTAKTRGPRSRDASSVAVRKDQSFPEGDRIRMPIQEQEQDDHEQCVDPDLIREILFSSESPLHTVDILIAANHFADRVVERTDVQEAIDSLLEASTRPIKSQNGETNQFKIDRRSYTAWRDDRKRDLDEVGKWSLSIHPWDQEELEEICRLTLSLENDPSESDTEIGGIAIRLGRRFSQVEEHALDFVKLSNGDPGSLGPESDVVGVFCRITETDRDELFRHLLQLKTHESWTCPYPKIFLPARGTSQSSRHSVISSGLAIKVGSYLSISVSIAGHQRTSMRSLVESKSAFMTGQQVRQRSTSWE